MPKKHYLTRLAEDFSTYLSQLPVLGFNSGKYDINAVKQYLYPLILETDRINFHVQKNNNHMVLGTPQLKFLDVQNYLAPGVSYKAFLEAYGCTVGKAAFPFDLVTGVDSLTAARDFPSRQDFYNTLKEQPIDEETYLKCKAAWNEKGMKNLKDLLIWYNNLDVTPFLEALEKMVAFYTEKRIDMFKDGISVPGLTLRYMFQDLEDYFTLFHSKDSDLYYMFKNNIVGGPSIVFNRYHEAGKTKIRNGDKTCQGVIGYDANALYLWSIQQDMPTGEYARRVPDPEKGGLFKLTKRAALAVDWLDYVAHKEGIHIRHKYNNVEKRVGKSQRPVDGYAIINGKPKVYQFQGCYFHSHQCEATRIAGTDTFRYNDRRGLTPEEMRADLVEQKREILSSGCEYEEIWECEFNAMKKCDGELRSFLKQRQRPNDNRLYMTEDHILREIKNGTMFGCAEVDIHVPDHLKPLFEEMTPIFKHADISVEDIGDFMAEYAHERKLMTKPRPSLIGSMFGKKILLATPLLCWYLEHGLVVTKIHQVVEYTPRKTFQRFGDLVTEARRAGDVDKTQKLKGETMKLLGNSAYGKTVTNKEKHRRVVICDDKKVNNFVNKGFFRSLNSVAENCHEVHMSKSSIKMDLPLQIGFFVYQYAKLRMLQFYYDCVDKYLDRSTFEYVQMDTDSAYIAVTNTDFDSLVRPELRDQYFREKHLWFPREDTEANKRFDKRKPGLFKMEWAGKGVVALCSKTYYCFGETEKFSSKGLNKHRNKLDKEKYLNVLKTRVNGVGNNRGFRVRNNAIATYEINTAALSYFYPKRKVLADGVSTTHLDI